MKAMVEIDEGIGCPNLSPKLFSRDYLAGGIEQRSQELQWLTVKTQPNAVLAQFTRTSIQLKIAESKSGSAWCRGRHVRHLKLGGVYHSPRW